MTGAITEADVEEAALTWLTAQGWNVERGPDIAPDTRRLAVKDSPTLFFST